MTTLEEHQEEILEVVTAIPELGALEILTTQEQGQATSNSRVSEWRLWVFIMAKISHLMSQRFESFIAFVNALISSTRIHNKAWYRDKALAFQFGFDLLPDSDKFDNGNATEAEISASKIIKKAAPIKLGNSNIRIKVATETNGELAAVPPNVMNALNAYFLEVTDFGSVVTATTRPADMLKAVMNIHFDPLVLDNTGKRLDGSDDTPVLNAFKGYLKGIEFNGQFVLNELERELQKVDGVIVADMEEAYSFYGLYDFADVNIPNVGLINQIRVPEAGYMELDENSSTFNYIAFSE